MKKVACYNLNETAKPPRSMCQTWNLGLEPSP